MYGLIHYFTFYADKDVRLPDVAPDEYTCEIYELDYGGAYTELEIQDSPLVNNSPLDDDKLNSIIGTQETLNLIATVDFALSNLYTENERQFLVIIRRNAVGQKFKIRWSLDDDVSGDLVDRNLQIKVNGVIVVDAFSASSGTFEATRGDTIQSEAYTGIAWPVVKHPYADIRVSGLESEITDDYTQNQVLTVNDLDRELDISVTSYYETDFIAMRSEVFYKSGLVPYPVTYTKIYHGASQAVANANAAYDGGFTAEGEAYAELALGFPAIWRGFALPDNCQEQFTFPPYPVSINCVDGLGLLKNFSFVQETGDIYIGKMSFLEVIYACLSRLGIPDMVLNTCVNVYEISMTQGNEYDPFALAFVNAERYFKEDGFTPMNCEEVLKSVLDEWKATILQSEGEWWIFRRNEAALSGTLTFRRYVDGAYTNYFDQNMAVILGGESEGEVLAPLFHINQDQVTMQDRPYKNSSISYRYGFLASLIVNPQFTGWNGVVFPDWSESNPLIDVDEDPLGGAKIGGTTGKTPPYYYLFNATSTTGAVGDRITFNMNYYNYRSDGARFAVILNSGPTYYTLNVDGSWVSGQGYNTLGGPYYIEGSVTIQSQPLPIAGDITVRLYEPSDLNDIAPSTDLYVTYRKADLTPFINEEAAIGEIHLATQPKEFTFLPEMQKVFNGDDLSEAHIGAIYQEDETTLTTLWVRRGIAESPLATPYETEKPFLRIAVEETVRMYATPMVRFEGSVFGYFAPLSRFSINLLTGKFMPLSYTYDRQANICKVTLGRVINDEIEQAYTLTSDFGDTTKVTIR